MLEKFEIARCLKPVEAKQIEIHYFSDGSETAYGSIAYARFIDTTGKIHCSPIMAKARPTPLNNSSHQTVPRIELNGAKLSVVLKEILQEELEYNIDKEIYWTDSTTVLKYIQSESGRFVRFVANRVSYIRKHTDQSQWRYVPSSQNPADHISRGISITTLLKLQDWKNGPAFLWKNENYWPSQDYSKSDKLEEVKENIVYRKQQN